MRVVFALAIATACNPKEQPKPEPARSAAPAPVRSVEAPAPRAKPEPKPPTLRRSAYPWLQNEDLEYPDPVEPLAARFVPPDGFQRVEVGPESFGAWLRGLPMAATDTPVRTHRGGVLHPASDPRIAGVVSLDIGKADLQQCADAIMRLHAEWSWHRETPDVSYRAASGLALPYARWRRGERVIPSGASIHWKPTGQPRHDHASFRKYLNQVFAWANTVSLAKQASKIPSAELRPGDFFILPGNPGHAVIVLDMARAPNGGRVALLGQSFMPAQSFQVLRSEQGSPWFALDPEQPVRTPFWEPFPWDSARRLDPPAAAPSTRSPSSDLPKSNFEKK